MQNVGAPAAQTGAGAKQGGDFRKHAEANRVIPPVVAIGISIWPTLTVIERRAVDGVYRNGILTRQGALENPHRAGAGNHRKILAYRGSVYFVNNARIGRDKNTYIHAQFVQGRGQGATDITQASCIHQRVGFGGYIKYAKIIGTYHGLQSNSC